MLPRFGGRRRLTAAVVGVGLAACASGDDEARSAAVTNPQTDEAARMVCGKMEACTSPTLIRNIFGGLATCRARHSAQIERQSHARGYGSTESESSACKQALEAATCQQVMGGMPVEPCRVPGLLPDGASCIGDGQCASQSCFVDENASCGTCGPPVPEGGDCRSAQCAAGLECTRKKKCVKPAPEGADCDVSGDLPCEALLFCGGNKCVKGLSKGAECKLAEGAVPCDFFKGLVCVPNGIGSNALVGTCDEVSISKVGVNCDVISIEPFKYALCEGADCVNGICVAKLPDGASCSPDGPRRCQEPAKCRNGRCALRDPAVCD